eukprot:6842146-Prymnesium_polylepis.1
MGQEVEGAEGRRVQRGGGAEKKRVQKRCNGRQAATARPPPPDDDDERDDDDTAAARARLTRHGGTRAPYMTAAAVTVFSTHSPCIRPTERWPESKASPSEAPSRAFLELSYADAPPPATSTRAAASAR